MNIAVFYHDNDMYSGASRSMLSLMEDWKKEGNNVIVFLPKKGTMFQNIREKQFSVYEIPHFRTRINCGRGMIYRGVSKVLGVLSYLHLKLYVSMKISRIIDKENIEVLYSNTTATTVGYELKKKTGLPLVWHVREFGIADQNCEYVFGRKRLLNKLNCADLVVFISEAVKKAYMNGLTQPKQIVAYNDISSTFDSFVERKWNKKTLTALSVGSIIPGKGHKYVIDAVLELHKRGKNIALKIAGKGKEYERELKDYLNQNDVDHIVEMLGQVDDMKQLRADCDIGIVASEMEAFGRVTIEGMLSGMVMIGSDSGGTSELIKEGKTGLLFKPGNVTSLVEKIELLINNRDLAKQMADEGYAYSKRFTVGDCAGKILEEMSVIVQNRRC